jgi:D-xylose reductase
MPRRVASATYRSGAAPSSARHEPFCLLPLLLLPPSTLLASLARTVEFLEEKDARWERPRRVVLGPDMLAARCRFIIQGRRFGRERRRHKDVPLSTLKAIPMAAGGFEVPKVEAAVLERTGDRIPLAGFGLWKVAKEEAAQQVYDAIVRGWRHFDFAYDYGNEREAGEGLRRAMAEGLVKREELFLTSKLWCTQHAPEHVRPACERSISDLGVSYLDLYLVHFPMSLRHVPLSHGPSGFANPETGKLEPVVQSKAETWHAMEELVDAGLARNIGVSNFNVVLIREMIACSRKYRPQVLQVELHPHLQQARLLRFCAEEKIVVEGYSPLGAGSYVPLGAASASDDVLKDATIGDIAAKHGVSPAQVVLRWGVQRGTVVLPKTSRPERLTENLSLFHFSLDADDLARIAKLERAKRYNDPGIFCEASFGTFFPIFD